MSNLSEQLPIKISPEMKKRLQRKHMRRLKAGDNISISQFVRCLLNKALDDYPLSYDEMCLLGACIMGQKNQPTWFRPVEGWEHVEDALFQRDLIVHDIQGAFIASQQGIDVWNNLQSDQRNNLLVPEKREMCMETEIVNLMKKIVDSK